ncbi:MAG: vWA domain-containing protein [Candidatus Riflemargulisbacteria bacterium]
MKKEKTHITIILDKSGSMGSCLNDTIGGFNTFLKAQRELEGTATMTLVQFNGHYDVISDMAPLSDTGELTNKNYVPNGGTALLDAIGRTINNVESKINDMAKKSRPEKVIFVIITDGEENESVEFTKDQIMQMINAHRDEQKWEFVFIGANQDAIQAGGDIGVRAKSTLSYEASSAGTSTMYTCLTKSMSTYRSASRSVDESLKMGFFSNEEDEK